MARIGGRGDLLSHMEEVALGRRAQSGDGEARLRQAVCVVREYRGRGLPFEDLFRRGTSGSCMQNNSESPAAGGCMRVCASVY
jgi:DNA-directed RNA polymerase sigma subunit (sigma70/sigma32)